MWHFLLHFRLKILVQEYKIKGNKTSALGDNSTKENQSVNYWADTEGYVRGAAQFVEALRYKP